MVGGEHCLQAIGGPFPFGAIDGGAVQEQVKMGVMAG